MNWSVALVSSLTFTGRVQLPPPSLETDRRTSALTQVKTKIPVSLHDPSLTSAQAT